jgi:hypothetical protein
MYQPNLIDGIYEIVHGRVIGLPSRTGSAQNPLTSGEGLELYFKDRLALVPDGDYRDRGILYKRAFCFEGAPNHPPDIMYRGGDHGDAFEVKKSEGDGGAITLNNSAPKDRLLATDLRIARAARECGEEWAERNLYFVVGSVPSKSHRLRWLWIMDCRLSSPPGSVFEEGVDRLRRGIESIPGFHFTPTTELGKINDFTPGVHLRMRQTWSMVGPWKMFGRVRGVDARGDFTLHALIREERWLQYPEFSRDRLLSLEGPDFRVSRVPVMRPGGGPDIDAMLIRWEFADRG